MHPDKDIISKMNALAADFKAEAEKQSIEAGILLDSGDYRGYFASMRKYGELTKRQVDVRMMEIDVVEREYNEYLKLHNND
jgi:hypothetical protein